MSQLQANDSSWNRRISAGFGAGVLSWNGQSGDVIGTLANIYAFGLGHSAATDNLFDMPAYTWNFPGKNGATNYAIGAFETVQLDNFATWNYVQRKGVHSRNYSATFNLFSMNDPAWDGGEGTLAPVQTWITEDIRYGNATTISPDELVNQAPMASGVWQWQDGSTWFFDRTNASSSFSLAPGKRMSRSHTFRADYLFGDGKWIDSVDSYGNRQVTQVVDLNSVHGLVPVDLAQVDYVAGSLQPDDGIGYFLATGSLQDLNGTRAKGWLAARSVAAGGSDGDWYMSLAVSSAIPAGGMIEWLRGYTDVGAKVLVGGLQLPSVDTSTFAVSDATTARLAWDDTRGLELSGDGGAYAALLNKGAVGQQVFVSAEVDLTAAAASYAVVPALAGKSFVPTRLQFFVTAAAGSITTAPTTSATIGGASFVASGLGPTAATFALGAPSCQIASGGNGIATAANTPLLFNVTTPATGTGGFQFKCKVIVTGVYL